MSETRSLGAVAMLLIYATEEIDKARFDWWYNFILQDMLESLDKKSQNYDQEWDLLSDVSMLLQNRDGSFTPDNSDETMNITKELLDGKTIAFDLDSIADKNVKLSLGGQLLSNPEKEMLKVALNSIRYHRQNKNK